MYNQLNALHYFNFSVFLHFIGRLLYRTFVPIILLQNGYSLNYIFIYLMGYIVITIFTSYLITNLLSKKNILFIYILAIISEILLVTLLIPDKISYVILIFIILMEGFYYSSYYISNNSILNHYNEKSKTSNNLGNLSIFSSFASIIAPIIGAILLNYNKNIFIIVSIVFLIASIIPLFKITRVDINGKKFKKIKFKDIKKELVNCGIATGIEFLAFIVWPIYVYLEGFSLIYVGLIPAIVSITKILFLTSIKKKLISNKLRYITKIISIITIALISLYRFYFPKDMIITNFIISLSYIAFLLSVRTDYFEKVKNYQTYHSSMLLEIVTFSFALISIVFAYYIGLKYSILIPIIWCFIWIIFNFKDIRKELIWNNKIDFE